jgi:hypothetical protein
VQQAARRGRAVHAELGASFFCIGTSDAARARPHARSSSSSSSPARFRRRRHTNNPHQQAKTDATRAQLNYRIQRIVSLFKRHGFR